MILLKSILEDISEDGRLRLPNQDRAESPVEAAKRRIVQAGIAARSAKGLHIPPGSIPQSVQRNTKPVEPVDEATELRSLVAKAQGEQHANKIAQFLNSNNIEARAAEEAVFNPDNQTEQPGWGIFVTPKNVVDAGELLHRQKMAHGLSFDPYVQGGK